MDILFAAWSAAIVFNGLVLAIVCFSRAWLTRMLHDRSWWQLLLWIAVGTLAGATREISLVWIAFNGNRTSIGPLIVPLFSFGWRITAIVAQIMIIYVTTKHRFGIWCAALCLLCSFFVFASTFAMLKGWI